MRKARARYPRPTARTLRSQARPYRSPHHDAGIAQRLLHVRDPQVAEVEDTRGEYGVRTGFDRGREVLRRARSPAGDQRYVDHRPHRADELQVEALLGAVGVHRVQQDLARTQLATTLSPLDRVQA